MEELLIKMKVKKLRLTVVLTHFWKQFVKTRKIKNNMKHSWMNYKMKTANYTNDLAKSHFMTKKNLKDGFT
jgi:hypothetical protein